MSSIKFPKPESPDGETLTALTKTIHGALETCDGSNTMEVVGGLVDLSGADHHAISYATVEMSARMFGMSLDEIDENEVAALILASTHTLAGFVLGVMWQNVRKGAA